jgi:hypothetical protein
VYRHSSMSSTVSLHSKSITWLLFRIKNGKFL